MNIRMALSTFRAAVKLRFKSEYAIWFKFNFAPSFNK